jgi:hypothetical protein
MHTEQAHPPDRHLPNGLTVSGKSVLTSYFPHGAQDRIKSIATN